MSLIVYSATFPLQVQLLQGVIRGVDLLIKMEKRLEKGEGIEGILPLKLQANVPASPVPDTPATIGGPTYGADADADVGLLGLYEINPLIQAYKLIFQIPLLKRGHTRLLQQNQN